MPVKYESVSLDLTTFFLKINFLSSFVLEKNVTFG
jgi:hypothetical protein